MAKLHLLVKEVTENMNAYRLTEASRPIGEFITELSQWYVRRSRDRFKQGARSKEQGANGDDVASALTTLHEVLLTLAKVMAPFTPFMAEKIYQELATAVGGVTPEGVKSVHLELWPAADESLIDTSALHTMEQVRKIVEMGLALRAEARIKVRQPLHQFAIFGMPLSDEYRKIIADELNVHHVVVDLEEITDAWRVKDDGGLKVALETTITEALEKEGLAREIVRAINTLRKEKQLTIHDKITVAYRTDDPLLNAVFIEFAEEIREQVLAASIVSGGTVDMDIDGHPISLSLDRA